MGKWCCRPATRVAWGEGLSIAVLAPYSSFLHLLRKPVDTDFRVPKREIIHISIRPGPAPTVRIKRSFDYFVFPSIQLDLS